jgi:hypothetical protein
MKRAIPILIITWAMTGCKSQTPTVDPFFGRTTVPPPSTGSIAGQSTAPYYTPPMQPLSSQANASYNNAPPYNNAPSYNPGINSTNPANQPSYAGSPWTNPPYSPPGSTRTNPPNSPQYPAPTSSALTGPSPTAPMGASSYPMQSVPQYNPAVNQSPYNYPSQAPTAQPASMPTNTSPAPAWPGGNRYAPPSGNFNNNYRGTSNDLQNAQPVSQSPNRVATPYFAGGTPNRTSIPATDNSPRAFDYSRGNNYLIPASRQNIQANPAQIQNNSTLPTWRESSSSDTRLIDDNIEPVSNTETADAGAK